MYTTLIENKIISCRGAKLLWHKWMKTGVYYDYFPSRDSLVEEPEWDNDSEYKITVEKIITEEDLFYLWDVQECVSVIEEPWVSDEDEYEYEAEFVEDEFTLDELEFTDFPRC